MKLQEIAILLPCHSLEDFPTDGDAEAADGLLAAWTVLWHPMLLAAAGRKPSWYRADNPPHEFEGRLFVIPSASEPHLLGGWSQRATDGGAAVVRGETSRPGLTARVLAAAELDPEGVDAATTADFFALGFAYLQVELLTRQMRYMSNLDQIHMENQSVAAARAALARDSETAHTHLVRCFEALLEARERFYPVDSYLIDLTLVAETTLTASLARELASESPTSFLTSGAVVDKLFAVAPENGARLRDAITGSRASLVGGEWEESELPLVPINDLLDNFTRGLAAYERHLGVRPTVFGRRRAGLSPLLPQVLSRFGFRGALHVTLDDGIFPRSDQSRIRWEGTDQSSIDCLARVPLDANRPESYLKLCRTLGDSMDRDHVATLLFAHWPGAVAYWHQDLRRAARFSKCLGKFVTLDEYFSKTSGAGRIVRFEPHKYRVPYLHDAVAQQSARPVSAIVSRHERAGAEFSAATMRTVGRLLECPAPTEGDDPRAEATASVTALARHLVRGAEATQEGVFIFNPHLTARTFVVSWPADWGWAAQGDASLPQQRRGDRVEAVVTIPGMSYQWLALAKTAPVYSRPKGTPPLVEGTVMRNDRLEVAIAADTGAIRALRDLRTRGTLLSQQLALRWAGSRSEPGEVWRDPDESATYSVMAADGVEVTSAGPAFTEIMSHGRLLHTDGRVAARFRQTCRLPSGGRLVELHVELDPIELPAGNPWETYYASRFAWADASADLMRSAAGGRSSIDAKQVEAPQFIEIEDSQRRLAIVSAGLPYHRRASLRMLDTILIPGGETRRCFRMALGVDVAYPYQEAWAMHCPALAADMPTPCPAAGPQSWLFHLDAKNLLAVRWTAVETEGQVVGATVRLLEIAGRAGRGAIRCFRNLVAAKQLDFTGQTLTELSVSGDAATIDFGRYEWLDVELRWK